MIFFVRLLDVQRRFCEEIDIERTGKKNRIEISNVTDC